MREKKLGDWEKSWEVLWILRENCPKKTRNSHDLVGQLEVYVITSVLIISWCSASLWRFRARLQTCHRDGWAMENCLKTTDPERTWWPSTYKWLVQVDGSKSLHGKMVVEPTHESRNMRKSNWIISPRDQGENIGRIPPIDTQLRICVFPPGVVSNMFCRKIPKELDPFGARQNSKEKNEDWNMKTHWKMIEHQFVFNRSRHRLNHRLQT